MGLLSKAAVKADLEPDSPGKGPKDNRRRSSAQKNSPVPDIIANELRQYHTIHSSFQGIVIASPGGKKAGDGQGEFAERISQMVSSFGSVFSLPPGNYLVLFPETMDRELLAHRLSKSLNTRVLYHFQADDPGIALQQLISYL
jgi:hypothetical protein